MHKVAIIGYRARGKRLGPAFAGTDGCKIVGVCDIVEERAREGADTYGVKAYTDVDELLAKEEFDIACIPVGEQFRYDLVIKCLRADKHIFTEKPLAGEEGQYRIKPSDVVKAWEMIEEWQRHPGRQFGICFSMHYMENMQWAKQRIRGGILGDFRFVHALTMAGSWNHLIDIVRYLSDEVTEVCAFADNPGDPAAKAVALHFENGGVGTLVFLEGVALQFQIKWVGTLGEITINDLSGDAWCRLHPGRSFGTPGETENFAPLGLTGYPAAEPVTLAAQIADFIASIREGRQYVADGWAGLRHMEIDAAITESMRTGDIVPVQRHGPADAAPSIRRTS
jgi:predicted dehydrogenase